MVPKAANAIVDGVHFMPVLVFGLPPSMSAAEQTEEDAIVDISCVESC